MFSNLYKPWVIWRFLFKATTKRVGSAETPRCPVVRREECPSRSQPCSTEKAEDRQRSDLRPRRTRISGTSRTRSASCPFLRETDVREIRTDKFRSSDWDRSGQRYRSRPRKVECSCIATTGLSGSCCTSSASSCSRCRPPSSGLAGRWELEGSCHRWTSLRTFLH